MCTTTLEEIKKMNRLKVVLAVLVLLILCQAAAYSATAATLDSTWYVKVTGVDIWKYVWDPTNHYYFQQGMGSGYFYTPPGKYGPFQV